MPANIRMEPSRPTVLCDHVTAAHGSFGTLAGSRRCHLSRNPTGAVLDALRGTGDDAARAAFQSALGDHLAQFEAAIVAAYDDWLDFEKVFAKDRDSATVVGFLCSVIARLTISTNLLTLGHLTVSGSAFRQAQEALASAFLMAEFEAPYRAQLWDGRFPVHKAVSILRAQAKNDRALNVKAVDVLFKSRSFYNKFSHPTALAMADTISLNGGGHHLGASFDPKKRPFYEREIASRVGFATMLPNAIDGVANRMRTWPQFKKTG